MLANYVVIFFKTENVSDLRYEMKMLIVKFQTSPDEKSPRVLRNLDNVFQDYRDCEFAAAVDSQPHMDGEMISQTGTDPND